MNIFTLFPTMQHRDGDLFGFLPCGQVQLVMAYRGRRPHNCMYDSQGPRRDGRAGHCLEVQVVSGAGQLTVTGSQ